MESNSAYGTEKRISLVISLVASLQQTAWHCSSLFFFSYRRKLFFLDCESRDIERETSKRRDESEERSECVIVLSIDRVLEKCNIVIARAVLLMVTLTHFT